MSDPLHPTNKEWEMFDPLVKPPPLDADLLILNEGGVLIRGRWYEGALAWAYKPVVPKSVKLRMDALTKSNHELGKGGQP